MDSLVQHPWRGLGHVSMTLTSALALLLACDLTAPQQQEPVRALPANLLILVSDDQSRCDLSVYGNAACPTPIIDGLAAEGLRFDRGFTPAAVCMPSRSCYYTGLYPHQNGAMGFLPINEGVTTWPELLSGHCLTGLIGKFNVFPKERFPFDFSGRTGSLRGRGRSPERYGEVFREFLAQVEEQRFSVVVNIHDPHRPFDPSMFEPSEGLSAVPAPEDVWLPPFLWDTPETRAELVDYCAALQRLDRTVGVILDELEAAGHRDDTLVIFTSDNGMAFPFAKATLYEAGINLPFIVRWPGVVEPGGSSTAMVSLIDLLPTALEIFDAPAASSLTGHSLLPLLRGETDSLRDAVFAFHDQLLVGEPLPARAVREERYKYIRNFEPEAEFVSNVLLFSQTWSSWEREAEQHPELAERMHNLRFRPPEELFDLEQDPWELNNLIADPGHAEILERLRGRLRTMMRETGDPVLAAWPE